MWDRGRKRAKQTWGLLHGEVRLLSTPSGPPLILPPPKEE